MAEYRVEVEFTVRREIDVYAHDRQEAMEKAAELALGWNNVVNADAIDAEEI